MKMTIINKDQLRALLHSVKQLHVQNNAGTPVEVTNYYYENHGYLFSCLNTHGLKRLLSANRATFEFSGLSIFDSSTDLIPGLYEGGFKVWECSEDLLKYCLTNEIIKADQIVCDIGCGAGVLGILGLRLKASQVHFLDYNKEVLQWFTLPNILNNLADPNSTDSELMELALNRSKFYAGDWQTVNKALGSIKYDVMLTSETIYSKDNYSKLLALIKEHLKPEGVCLVAAKVYYFGLSGGCFEFIEFVCKHSELEISEVETIEASLQRKILKLTFKN